MVPGRTAIIIGIIVSAIVLLVMGVISFQNSKKERRAAARKQAREEARRLQEEADAAFEQETQNAFLLAEEDLGAENAPWEMPLEEILPAEEPEQPEEPVRSTRNDFDFKF